MSRRCIGVRAALGAAFILLAGGCVQPGQALDPNATTDGQATQNASLRAPRLISPGADAERVAPNLVQLVWSATPGATAYEVYLGPDTNPPLLVRVPGTSYLLRDLPTCMRQYWRVLAVDADGPIVSSTIGTFETRCDEAAEQP
jgi:hypothetical protein